MVSRDGRIQELAKSKDSEGYCMNIMNFMSVYTEKRQYLDEDIVGLV